jgi:RNA polymerase sigma factor (sigma-70 family)
MEITDVTLLRRWQKDSDSKAFTEIVARHSAMVFTTCNRILRNAADAEDVTQECFVELGSVRTLVGKSLGGLLHTLATHRSLDRLKGESRRREREIRFSMERGAQETTSWDDIQPHIDEAIADLSDKFRGCIIQHFLEGVTHAEVARSLGIGESTVRYRINKGIEQVRKSLKHRGIALTAAALVPMLDAAKAEATSAGLTASLGKLALAGVGPSTSASATVALGGGTVILKILLTAAVVVALAGGVAWNLGREAAPPTPVPVQATYIPLVNSEDSAPTEPEDTRASNGPSDETALVATATALDISMGAIAGRVYATENNAPLGDVYIWVKPDEKSQEHPPAVQTDVDGRYYIDNLPPGPTKWSVLPRASRRMILRSLRLSPSRQAILWTASTFHSHWGYISQGTSSTKKVIRSSGRTLRHDTSEARRLTSR